MTPRRLTALVLLAGTVGLAQRKEPAIYLESRPAKVREMPPSRSMGLGPAARVMLGALSAQERAMLGPVGLTRRIGVHRALPEASLERGTWSQTASGLVWRVAIHSSGATGVRVEFSNFSVGDGKVWVHSGESVDGPYTGRGPYGNGEFWSGTVAGEAVTIELKTTQRGSTIPFHVHKIAHEAFDVSATAAPPDLAASCEQDVNCYPDWLNAKKSAAQIQFEETQGSEQGTFVCSGALVGTRDNSNKPYLLTAGHCIHDEPAARSLETFWAFESAACNLGPPADRGSLQSQNGGHLLAWATIEQGDYSLVLLPDVPSGVVFAGWDTADPPIGSGVAGIHHPMGSYKRISFGTTFPGADVFIGSDPAPAALYHNVGWDLGITEPGSSGSPLFSSPGVVVGMLTYGPDSPGELLCQTGSGSGYGKFSNAYQALQAYFEDFPVTQLQLSTASLQFTGRNHAIAGSATQSVTLSVGSPAPVTWSARADAPWVQVSQTSGTVTSLNPATFLVTVNPKYFIANDTYTATITITSGAAPPQFIDVQATMQIDASNVVVSANPNPVPESGTSWQLSLELQETGGAATRLNQLKIDGADYSSNIAGWFGSALLPANGTLSATIHTSGLTTPVTKYFEFFGQDVASGETWYRLLTVTFTR